MLGVGKWIGDRTMARQANKQYWNAMSTDLGLPARVLELLFELWVPQEYPSFRAYVEHFKECKGAHPESVPDGGHRLSA